jgi:hypothetical protein
MLESDVEALFRGYANAIVRNEDLEQKSSRKGYHQGVIDGLRMAMLQELHHLWGDRRDEEWFRHQIDDAIHAARKRQEAARRAAA